MKDSMEFIEAFNMNLALYNQLNDNGRIMREQDQGLLSHVNQMRVQLLFRWDCCSGTYLYSQCLPVKPEAS